MGSGPTVIVGGGIAGLATAVAMAQRGLPVLVLEARDGPGDRSDGLFLNAASNGVGVLDRLGAAESVLAEGSPCTTHLLKTGRGRILGDVTNGSAHGKLPSVIVQRGVVTHALVEACARAGVRIHYGARLAQLTQDDDGVRLTTTAGETFAASLALGCDGIHSRVRTHLMPDAPRPTYTGLQCVGGLAVTPGLATTSNTLTLVFGHEAFFGYLTDRGRTYWFSNIIAADEPANGSLDTIDPAVWTEQLSRFHERDCSPIGTILASEQETVVAYPLYDMPRIARWSSGRVCIVGDAAHATSPHAGQGASMALEDAVTMASCLDRSSDPGTAFAEFEHRRRDRVDRIVRFSRRMGDNKAIKNPFGLALRDALMPVALRFLATPQRRAWMYDHPLALDAELGAR